MANICNFQMLVKGKRENIESFLKAMNQDGDIWMGRGAETYVEWKKEDKDDTCAIANVSGSCKWSIVSALIDNAKSMERQRLTGVGSWHEDEQTSKVKRYMSLPEACTFFNVNMEVYSEEEGCCFQEHMKAENIVKNGERTLKWHDECCEWSVEYDDGERINETGGYPSWNFDLKEPQIGLLERLIA